MGLNTRLKRLEKQAQSRLPSKWSLFDGNSKRVDAEILQMPEPTGIGMALLPDGSKVPIKGRSSDQVVVVNADEMGVLTLGSENALVIINDIPRPPHQEQCG